MEIEFLGTGAGAPSKSRNVTSVALKLLDEINEVWLFDVGEATQHQILKTNLRPRKIAKIFITHMHGDHIFGLPGFLSSRSFQNGEEAIDIYGPVGIKDYVMMSLKLSGTHLGYRINFHELKNDQGVLIDDQNFRVEYALLDHRIASFGYRITEADKPGELLVDKLREENVPSGPLYGKLKSGEDVTLPDGRTLYGHDYVGPTIPGRVVAIFGDTRISKNHQLLAHNADVIVHESTFASQERDIARQYYHSASTQVAQMAKDAKAKHLLLTHISARYLGKSAQILQKQAEKIFPGVRVANDFSIFKIPPKKGV
ncbi:ribonuclease Z [Xylocopilactobacillus apicola]|uniref:Ribonuclease Z n=1 Tax=Xylocopilactobacillus apicola TaxID=2932184 RepID=A0AAU9DT09_9LACO|nr:ribonuclease Z [Xylocopilactobacillus apicola]BDR59239.1 ribonuclease Z [Xylocopilactobacillus apicola]